MTELERKAAVAAAWVMRDGLTHVANEQRMDAWHERRAMLVLADMGPLVLPWRPRSATVLQFRRRAG